MDENLTPIEKLDKFLTYFMEMGETDDGRTSRLSSEVHKETGSGDKKEMFEILHKLETDGYINGLRRPFQGQNVTMYYSTFDGRIFYINGGYKKQQENIRINEANSARNERRMVRNEIWLLRGTWAAAMIGFLVLVWYIFLFYFPHYSDYPYHWIWEKSWIYGKK